MLNTAYCVFLINAYRYGGLSHVYPISRGCSPLVVAFISVAIVGETLTMQAGFSVVVIALGIMSLTVTRGAGGFREPKAMLYAVGTGVFIAGYTVVDGLGARLAESAESYTFWAHLFNGIPITLVALYLRRGQVRVSLQKCWKVGVLGGHDFSVGVLDCHLGNDKSAFGFGIRSPGIKHGVRWGLSGILCAELRRYEMHPHPRQEAFCRRCIPRQPGRHASFAPS
ncbi:membrane hypothetical protein [Mesorhizobium metallidurans STM 2683]|uniref:EamA domain-containing protein n=1 Tax=Mesorhizobium metallidurans STM 2683 TaxID=1297569 RepID=M5ETM1_9HYPH|nr:membrane hypothetical protein [Mesorhizobium metallidurans STM 2683]